MGGQRLKRGERVLRDQEGSGERFIWQSCDQRARDNSGYGSTLKRGDDEVVTI